MPKMGIFFYPAGSAVTGPNKVVMNLLAGLQKIGVEYRENALADFNGCLQSWAPDVMRLPADTLMGPNVVSTFEAPWIWNRYSRFLANSWWTKEAYEAWPEGRGKIVGVWPVGIDTDRFNDAKRNPTKDCLVYFKPIGNILPTGELGRVLSVLSSKKLSCSVLEYGKYKEGDLLAATKIHRCCILVTGTESQGIAYMEMLSSGLPCYVMNVTEIESGGKRLRASSVPYFSDTCGICEDGREMKRLDEFFSRLKEFDPREYILSRHTLAGAATRYCGLLQGKKDHSYEVLYGGE